MAWPSARPWLGHAWLLVMPWPWLGRGHGSVMAWSWLGHGLARPAWSWFGRCTATCMACGHGSAIAWPWLSHGLAMAWPWPGHGSAMACFKERTPEIVFWVSSKNVQVFLRGFQRIMCFLPAFASATHASASLNAERTAAADLKPPSFTIIWGKLRYTPSVNVSSTIVFVLW